MLGAISAPRRRSAVHRKEDAMNSTNTARAIITAVGTAALLLSASAIAAPRGDRTGGERPDRPRPPLSGFRANFDANGDGRIDRNEADELREALPEYHDTLIAPFDTSGDGLLSPEEFRAAAEALGFPPREGPMPNGGPDAENGRKPGLRGQGAPRGDRKPLDRVDGEPGPRGPRAAGGDRPGGPGGQGGPGGGPDREQIRQRLLERFDANGDGQRDDDERANARAHALSRRFATMLERVDTNGDAELSEEEVAVAIEKIEARRERGPRGNGGEARAELIEKFDVDGDGRLSDLERQIAREFIAQQRGK